MKISQLLVGLGQHLSVDNAISHVHKEADRTPFRLIFEYINWLWQFWWRNEWTSAFITRLGLEVNITLIQDDESIKICVGSWIKDFTPNWDFITSIRQPLHVVVSRLYQLCELALTSQKLKYLANEKSF